MTFGRWNEIYHAYKLIHNMRQKIYSDIEEELLEYRKEHQPVASLMDL